MLVLRVLFNFILYVVYKYGRFFIAFSKKHFKFVFYIGDSFIKFEPSYILLLAEANLILEKQDCKDKTFMTFGLSNLKIAFKLLAKIETLHIQVSKV